MVQAQRQKSEFQDRLDRIRRGAPNTLGHVYVGPVEECVPSSRPKRSGPLAVIWALLVGTISYLLGHLLQFKAAPMLEDAYPQMAAFWTGGGAFCIALLLIVLMLYRSRLSGLVPYLAAMVGVVFAVGLHQYLVESAPEFHASLYSDVYVQQVLGTALVAAPNN